MLGRLRFGLPVVVLVLLMFGLSGSPEQGEDPVEGVAGWAAGCDGRTQTGLRSVEVTSQGETWPVTVHLPPGYDGRTPLALVLNFHGSNSNPADQLGLSDFRAAADRHGFVAAAPAGGIAYPGSATGRAWNIPGVPLFGNHPTPGDARDEVRFVDDVLDDLGTKLCLDEHRVYATGFSGGARMTSLVGCRLADRVAAIAPVAGLRAGNPDTGRRDGTPRDDACEPSRPVPVLTFHGTDDRANPYNGDDSKRWRYPLATALRRWARLDGCAAKPVTTPVSKKVQRISYPACSADAEVTAYVAAGAGHTWPGMPGGDDSPLGVVNRDFSANDLMWDFFARHPRP